MFGSREAGERTCLLLCLCIGGEAVFWFTCFQQQTCRHLLPAGLNITRCILPASSRTSLPSSPVLSRSDRTCIQSLRPFDPYFHTSHPTWEVFGCDLSSTFSLCLSASRGGLWFHTDLTVPGAVLSPRCGSGSPRVDMAGDGSWILHTVNFTLLSAGHVCIPTNTLKP